MMASCSWLMHQPEETVRIPQEPPSQTKSSLPHNRVPRAEADSALGGFNTQRR